MEKPMKHQIGGNHYIKLGTFQPLAVGRAWCANMTSPFHGYCLIAVLQYLARAPFKQGVESLKKARHLLDIWIEDMEKK